MAQTIPFVVNLFALSGFRNWSSLGARQLVLDVLIGTRVYYGQFFWPSGRNRSPCVDLW